MKLNKKFQIIIFFIVFMIIGTSSTSTHTSLSKNLSSLNEQGIGMIDGQILFAPYYTTTTYLIDNTGAINHTWSSSYQPFTSAYWLGNGTILRPIGSGGGVVATRLAADDPSPAAPAGRSRGRNPRAADRCADNSAGTANGLVSRRDAAHHYRTPEIRCSGTSSCSSKSPSRHSHAARSGSGRTAAA